MTVLVTGATGYVGSRLVPALLEQGLMVRASATSADKRDTLWWSEQTDTIGMDVDDDQQVAAAVTGVDTVVYLIHGLDDDDFVTKDRQAATRMAEHAAAAGVQRIVYLSGIVPPVPRDELSDHIRSRLEVEEALGSTGIVTVALRAAVLLGSGSTSFEIIRQLSERLPVHTIPSWLDSQIQPIAVVDAIAALVGAVRYPESRVFDIGGPERLSYPELLARYSTRAGLTRPQVPLPLATPALVGALAARLTDVPTPTVEALIDSLTHDMVAADSDYTTHLLPPGHRLIPIDEAIARALTPADHTRSPTHRDPLGPLPQDPTWSEAADT